MNRNSKKIAIFSFLVLFLTMTFLPAFSGNIQAADSGDIQSNIDKLEKKLKDAQAAKLQLEGQLNNINYSVAQTQKDILLTESIIKEVESEINRSEMELEAQNEKIKLQRQILTGLIQEMYYNQRESAPFIILAEKDFSAIFSKSDNLTTLQEKINELIEQIKGMQAVTLQTKNKLEVSQEQKEKLLTIKKEQKVELLGDKAETQADILDKQAVISQLNSKLNALREEYSNVLGKSVSVKDIIEAAAFASSATKMSKAFLLGVLMQESRGGKSVGGCTYPEIEKDAYKRGIISDSKNATSGQKTRTATFKRRKTIFEDLVERLNYKSSSRPVSCNPGKNNYTGTGGAMGVPQYMSDTWEYGGGKPSYKEEIIRLTGHKNPDPWNLLDGVTAMAIKLSRDGANQKTRFAEAKSYCTYLAGGNWGYYCFGSASKYKDDYSGVDCYNPNYIKNAGEKVLCLKDNYEKYY